MLPHGLGSPIAKVHPATASRGWLPERTSTPQGGRAWGSWKVRKQWAKKAARIPSSRRSPRRSPRTSPRMSLSPRTRLSPTRIKKTNKKHKAFQTHTKSTVDVSCSFVVISASTLRFCVIGTHIQNLCKDTDLCASYMRNDPMKEQEKQLCEIKC